MAPLTVRNLTATPLELKLVERYEAPGSGGPGNITEVKDIKSFGGFAKNLTSSLVGNVTGQGPSGSQLAESAQSFAHEDVNVRIDPFQKVDTGIQATERGPNDILRLTFESDGQRYRVDTPLPRLETLEFTPLVPDPRHRFTAVFFPNDTWLTIISSSGLNSWMGELNDQIPLSALSIPGTHNSPTCHSALPSVRCQAVSPREQLENGVRFFDIRVQPQNPEDPNSDGLILVHGTFPISLTGNKYFRDLINETMEFLDRNPSETVIISVKREGPGQHTDQQLSKIMRYHYANNNDRWWTEPRIPRLGEARRKIVVMRRFALDESLHGDWGGRGWALNAESWAYNTPNCENGDVIVQDFCEVLETQNIDMKIQYAREHMERAGCCECPPDDQAPPRFYLNFLSASNFWAPGCWPDKIAAKVNPAIVGYLSRSHHDQQNGDGTTGIVITDWVGDNGNWDLVRCIVGMNSKLSMKRPR